MRLVWRLAIVVGLSFGTAAAVGQRAAESANSGSQVPSPAATPNARTEDGPTAQTPGETAPSAAANAQTPAVENKAAAAEAAPAEETKTVPETETQAAPEASPTKSKATPASGIRKRYKRVARSAPGAPRKVVVREGGAKEPAAQIVPGMSSEEATRERQNAVQWLGSTDGQLQQLARRTLNAQQQETVGQIHSYMQGAQSALKEGDVGRASTLAQKAHLLSDDLVKH